MGPRGRAGIALTMAGAVAAVALVFAVWGSGAFRGGSGQFQSAASGYERAGRLFRWVTGQRAGYGLDVLVQAGAGQRVEDRELGLLDRLITGQRGLRRLLSPLGADGGGLVSRDGREAVFLAAFGSPAGSVAAARRLRVLLASPTLRGSLAGGRVLVGGPDVAFHELAVDATGVAGRVELIALPVLLLLLLVVFGGPVAACLPVLVGGAATMLALAVLRLVDQVGGVSVSVFAVPVVAGLGTGLGIDYSMLTITRYRQELANGCDPAAAVQVMVGTAGRTVLLSAVSIAATLGTLLLMPLGFLRSIGIAAAITALAAGAAALVLLPAALMLLGRRVDALAPTLLRRHGMGGGRSWQRIAAVVTGRPVPVACASTALLALIGVPALGVQLAAPDAQLLPAAAASRQLETQLAAAFAYDPAAAIYTLYRPRAGGPPAQALARGQAQVAGARAQAAAPLYLSRGVWELTLTPGGLPDSAVNQRLLGQLRGIAPPGALTGGATAFAVDQRTAIAASLPLTLAVITLISLIAMFLASGSVILALKAVLMAGLSMAAGLGVLTIAFQHAGTAGALGLQQTGGIEEPTLIFLATIALALSTDYEIFLISRITEERHHGLSSPQAIRAGVAQTGPLISRAALLFCVAVGFFAFSDLAFTEQFAIGAAATVAIDATIVRAVLAPSLMVLLGERGWWAPRWLAKLHAQVEGGFRGRLKHPSFQVTAGPESPP